MISMKKTLVLFLAIAVSGTLFSQTLPQNVLSPRLIQQTRSGHSTAFRVAPADTMTVFVTIDNDKCSWETLKEAGIQVIPLTSKRGTLRISSAGLQRLVGMNGVRYVENSDAPQTMIDIARQETGADRGLNGDGFTQSYTGRDVVVGIVDAGFDYLHSAFRNPENGELRIRRVWEQGSSSFEGCNPPEKFGYGLEFTTPEHIEKAKADREDNSHGTHVAALAAGSDAWNDGKFRGAAPDADIVLVALDLENSTNADIANGVAYIFDYAKSVNKPCVVNLSLGNHEGPHDGTSTFDCLTDELQGEGLLMVGAAGNHRADKFHVEKTFKSAEDEPLRTFVAYKTSPSTVNKGGSIEIWGDVGSVYEVKLSSYSIFNKQDAESVVLDGADGVQEVSLGRYVTGTLNVTSEISPLNGRPHMLITSDVTNIRMNYAIALTVTPLSYGRVNIWADNTKLGLESREIEGFTGPDDESTIAEIGGTGKRILTVGAYTTRNEYTTLNTTGTLDETLYDLCSFSSYGPTLDGRTKPDICAPGCFILSAFSAHDDTSTSFIAEAHEGFDGHTDYYGYMQGTSMAAPLTAGVVAAWLEAYPRLSPEDLHSLMEKTGRTDDFMQDTQQWGAGKLDAYAGLDACVKMSGESGIAQPSLPSLNLSVHGCKLHIVSDTEGVAMLEIFDASGRRSHRPLTLDLRPGTDENVGLEHLNSGTYIVSLVQGIRKARFKVVL